MRESLLLLRLIVLAPAFAVGCTGLEPAMIGAAASAGESGYAFWARGTLSIAVMTGDEPTVNAAVAACQDLSLEVTTIMQTGTERWTVICEDERERVFRIRIDERTETLSEVEIDIGLLGPRQVGELLGARLLHHTAMPAASLRQPAPAATRPAE